MSDRAMKASELIGLLSKLIDEHGDAPVAADGSLKLIWVDTAEYWPQGDDYDPDAPAHILLSIYGKAPTALDEQE